MPFIVYFLAGKLFALIVGVYYFRYLSRPYKLVLYLIAIASFCESYGYYIGEHLKERNLWIFNCYILIEVWLMGIAAIYLINTNEIKKIFLGLLIISTVIWGINIATVSIYQFASISMVFGLAFLTIMFIIVLFSNMLFNDNILKQPVFWLSLSTILYCACDIPYMGLHNYLSEHMPSLSFQLAFINSLLDIIRYPLVAISFILLGRQKEVVIKTV